MDPIKNVGAVDYSMAMPQQTQDDSYNDYSTMPMVYDPSVDEKKTSASNGNALKAIAATAIAGLAIIGAYKYGQSKGKTVEKTVEKIINEAGEDMTKKIDDLTASNEIYKTATKALKEGRENALKITEEKTYSIGGKAQVRNQVKEALNTEEIKKAEKAVEELEKTADKAATVADDVAKAVDNAADDATKAAEDAAK